MGGTSDLCGERMVTFAYHGNPPTLIGYLRVFRCRFGIFWKFDYLSLRHYFRQVFLFTKIAENIDFTIVKVLFWGHYSQFLRVTQSTLAKRNDLYCRNQLVEFYQNPLGVVHYKSLNKASLQERTLAYNKQPNQNILARH